MNLKLINLSELKISSQESLTFLAAIFGSATIMLGIAMLFVFPLSADLSEGFRTPIIAFEFAQTEEDLSFLSGSTESSRLNREKMDAGHVWDMVFPFAYAGFIALTAIQLASRGRRFIYAGAVLAVLIIPLDINENLTLLKITEALGNSVSIGTLLLELHTATWLKWGAIGISISVLALGFAASKEYLSAAISLLAALGIAAYWVFDSEPVLAELMSILLSLFILILSIKACLQSWSVVRQGAQ
ncbi:hypothetical protein [Zhongshania sp. BJYM1]|uniref:hypothetical protein n=1 Tax=Zhongshania aquatica TaxID=2965069 RepID=UPI0022B57035|nr:hypothetical protein [Marortus sp. BJYM1]